MFEQLLQVTVFQSKPASFSFRSTVANIVVVVIIIIVILSPYPFSPEASYFQSFF